LSSTGTLQSGSGFTITGDSVSGLAGGATQGGFDVGFDTSNLGNFVETLSFDVESSNSAPYDQIIGSVTFTIEGDIVSSGPSVPEPGTMGYLHPRSVCYSSPSAAAGGCSETGAAKCAQAVGSMG